VRRSTTAALSERGYIFGGGQKFAPATGNRFEASSVSMALVFSGLRKVARDLDKSDAAAGAQRFLRKFQIEQVADRVGSASLKLGK